MLGMARQLAEIISENPIADLNIMTNSIANAEVLWPVVQIILTGGEYRPKRRDTAGLIGKKVIGDARFSKSIIGLDAIDIADGLMAWDIETAHIE